MSTKEQSQPINKSIPTWVGVDSAQRAQLVIDWCAKSAIECRTSQAQLVAAMKHLPYWSQGPDNYLDVA